MRPARRPPSTVTRAERSREHVPTRRSARTRGRRSGRRSAGPVARSQRPTSRRVLRHLRAPSTGDEQTSRDARDTREVSDLRRREMISWVNDPGVVSIREVEAGAAGLVAKKHHVHAEAVTLLGPTRPSLDREVSQRDDQLNRYPHHEEGRHQRKNASDRHHAEWTVAGCGTRCGYPRFEALKDAQGPVRGEEEQRRCDHQPREDVEAEQPHVDEMEQTGCDERRNPRLAEQQQRHHEEVEHVMFLKSIPPFVVL